MTDMYLGKVCFANTRIAKLVPIASMARGKWSPLGDTTRLFPPEGKVLALKSDLLYAPEDSVWSFATRENPQVDKDRYLVDEAARAIPLVDLTQGSLEDARHSLFDRGVGLPAGADGQVVVLLPDAMMVELRLEPEPGRRLWRGTPSTAPVGLCAAPEWLQDAPEIDGFRYVPSRQALRCDAFVRRVDWSSDTDFVEHTINRFRRLKEQLLDTHYLLPAKNAVQFVTRALRESELLSAEPDILQNMERLRSQWPRLEAALGAASELPSLLLETPEAQAAIASAVAVKVESRVQEMRPAIEEQVRRDVEAELADVTRRRDDALDEAERAEKELRRHNAELHEAQKKCRDARAALESLKSSIDHEMESLRGAFEGVSAAELPYARMVATRLEAAVDEERSTEALLPPALPPWAHGGETREPSAVAVRAGLLGRLKAEAGAHAIREADIALIDGFARAGELVLLVGRSAERTLTAYARSVTGGRIRTMVLDASVIGLDDLWRVPGSQLPTAFAYAWNAAAATPHSTVLLCLRGLEASPLKAFLPALSSTLLSHIRPANLLTFALADSISNEDCGVEVLPAFAGGVAAFSPRDTAQAALRMLSEAPTDRSTCTVLTWEEPKGEMSTEMIALATKDGRNPSTALRAARVFRALRQTLNDPSLEPLLGEWAEALDTGSFKQLREPMKAGFEALACMCTAAVRN